MEVSMTSHMPSMAPIFYGITPTGERYIRCGKHKATGLLHKDSKGIKPAWDKKVKARTRKELTTRVLGVEIHCDRELTKRLGASPSFFYKVWRGCLVAVFLTPYKPITNIVGGTIPNIDLCRRNPSRVALCYQALEDGQKNLVPIIFALGKSPQELKLLFGKHPWKRIANNTVGRNRAIGEGIWAGCDPVLASKLPSTFLKNLEAYRLLGSTPDQVVLPVIAKFAKTQRCMRHTRTVKDIANLVLDTLRMSVQTGKTVNWDWSYNRFKEEHDKMSKEILAGKYSPAFLPVLQLYVNAGLDTLRYEEKDEVAFKYIHWTAELLTSALAIAEEGQAMRHCVAVYGNYVAEGKYLVYSIRRDGERYSTLGISVSESAGFPNRSRFSFRYAQHYKRYNASVDSNQAKFIAQNIVSRLNKLSEDSYNSFIPEANLKLTQNFKEFS